MVAMQRVLGLGSISGLSSLGMFLALGVYECVQLRTGTLGFALWFFAAAASPCSLPLGQH